MKTLIIVLLGLLLIGCQCKRPEYFVLKLGNEDREFSIPITPGMTYNIYNVEPINKIYIEIPDPTYEVLSDQAGKSQPQQSKSSE